MTVGFLPDTYPDSGVPPSHIPWLWGDSGVPSWHMPWLWGFFLTHNIPWLCGPSPTHALTLGCLYLTYPDSGVPPLTHALTLGCLPWHMPWLWGASPDTCPDSVVPPRHMPWLWGASISHTLTLGCLPWHIPWLWGASRSTASPRPGASASPWRWTDAAVAVDPRFHLQMKFKMKKKLKHVWHLAAIGCKF